MRGAARRQRLSDQPFVPPPAGLGAVGAEIVVTSAQGDEGLAASTMLAVLGQAVDGPSHRAVLPCEAGRNRTYRFCRSGNAALPSAGRSQKLLLRRDLLKMGAPRLELGTSALSGLRSNQLSYAPACSACLPVLSVVPAPPAGPPPLDERCVARQRFAACASGPRILCRLAAGRKGPRESGSGSVSSPRGQPRGPVRKLPAGRLARPST